jgi:hypothetical protein
MAQPVTSSSQPVQIPAQESKHADGIDAKKIKEKKAKADAASQYALEVRLFFVYGLLVR